MEEAGNEAHAPFSPASKQGAVAQRESGGAVAGMQPQKPEGAGGAEAL